MQIPPAIVSSPHRARRGVVALVLGVVLTTVPASAWLRAAATCPAPDSDADALPSIACLRQLYGGPRANWPAADVQPGVVWQELAPLPKPLDPPDNPTTPDKVALGQRLFNDPRLSRSGQIACASCHERELGWADGRRVSFGHDRQPGRRNAPSVRMAGHMQPLFWDGRAPTLEQQSLMPIADPLEMASSIDAAMTTLRSDPTYRQAFAEVFGSAPMTSAHLGQALAAFQRSLSPQGRRFDRFLAGNANALGDAELRGLHLFRTRAGCMNCHNGPTLSDQSFHNLGLHFHGRPRQDLGRYEVTGDAADSGRFRTPSLRGVADTAPYMHNGLMPRLDAVLLFYNVGGGKPRAPAQPAADAAPFPQPDPLLQPLNLRRDQLQDIEAFLRTL